MISLGVSCGRLPFPCKQACAVANWILHPFSALTAKLKDPGLAQQLGSRGAQRLDELGDRDSHADRLVEMYGNVLSRQGGARLLGPPRRTRPSVADD